MRPPSPAPTPQSSQRRSSPRALATLWLLALLAILSPINAAPAASNPAAPLTLPGPPPPATSGPPVELRFESPDETEQALARLRNIDPEALDIAFDRTGAPQSGPPIRVILARESSPLAQRVPPYVTGYAYGNVGVVVLLVDRVPHYPNRSMEELLRHEIAHVLIDRAAGHHPVPRWFHEGLATSIGNRWSLRDSSRALFAMRRVRGVPLTELGPYFQDADTVDAAYAVSTAFMRYLEERYGLVFPSLVLERVAEGVPFEEAFFQLTGLTLSRAQGQFLSQEKPWLHWFLWATSEPVIWGALSVLALYAMLRRRERLRQRLDAMEEEELEAEEEAALAQARRIDTQRREARRLRLVPPPGGQMLEPPLHGNGRTTVDSRDHLNDDDETIH